MQLELPLSKKATYGKGSGSTMVKRFSNFDLYYV